MDKENTVNNLIRHINFVPMIVPKRIHNTNLCGKVSKEFDTTDKIRLLSLDELKHRRKAELKKSNTDFALLTGAVQDTSNTAENGLLTGYWGLRSNKKYRICVNFDGSYCSQTYEMQIGYVPAFSLNIESLISELSALNVPISEIFETKITKKWKERHVIKMGEYPKTKVNNELKQTLEKMYNGGFLQSGLTCTGRLFTTNIRSVGLNGGSLLLSKQYPEFEYNGKKYVRYSPGENGLSRSNELEFADGERSFAYMCHWVEVEPVTFEVTNWDKLPQRVNPKGKSFGADTEIELETEEVIVSEPSSNLDGLWPNSSQRGFLNSAKSEDWDFTKSGFLYQAFDLTREPTRVYVVPKNEKEIGYCAFEGCVGLEKIIIHDGVRNIALGAFAGCVNTQIVFENLNSDIFQGLYEGTFSKSINYIYLSKDCENIILSPKIDPELEKTCVKKDYTFEGFRKFANQNYRQNFVNVTSWKENRKIKFIPPDYTLQTFPVSQMEKYFVNNNNQRWGKLVKTLGFDTLNESEKTNSLVDLMKIYYAIGGFSENQGESEIAYNYILQYVANPNKEGSTPSLLGEEIHSRFSRLDLQGPYNPVFAQFFMKYYKENPNFMNFQLQYVEKDYLCEAHNSFDIILKAYPNRVVNGNEERALLTPRFVAEHLSLIKYWCVEEGNGALANLIGRYGYSQGQFEHIQEVYDTAKKLKNTYVIRADKANEDSPVQFRVLEKDDPLGFVLGDITNCCQHIGGAGESCVDDGYTNPNAGFLVFEQSVLDKDGNPTTRILGQAYVWYDPVTKTVCYDNIEIPTKVLDEIKKGNKHEGSILNSQTFINAVEESAISIMKTMNKNGVKVERVTTGEGYNDLKNELAKKFEKERSPIATHRGYAGYSDAKEAQFIIKTYDQITNKYSDEIKTTAEEIKQDINEIRAHSAENQRRS